MFKLLAIIIMTIDHLANYLQDYINQPYYSLAREIGRLAFPIFAYQLALGYNRSRNQFKYLLRLCLSAICTEFILTNVQKLTGVNHHPNILITLSISLLLIISIDSIIKVSKNVVIRLRPVTTNNYINDKIYENKLWGSKVNLYDYNFPASFVAIASILGIVVGIALCAYFRSDYYIYGVSYPILFYVLNILCPLPSKSQRQENNSLLISNTFLIFICTLTFNLLYYFYLSKIFNYGLGKVQILSALACFLFPLEVYEKRPSKKIRYFFYFYYPLHLSIIFFIYYLLKIYTQSS